MKIDHHHSTAGSHGVLLRSLGFVVILTSLARAVTLGAEETTPPEFAGKIMPAEMRDDVKTRAAGKDIYEGKINPAVNCARCHGNDGKPTKLGRVLQIFRIRLKWVNILMPAGSGASRKRKREPRCRRIRTN